MSGPQLDRFEAGGIGALVTAWSDGRPVRWNEAYELLLVETTRHDPRWYGLDQSTWTCSLLAGYLPQQTGISLSSERARVLPRPHKRSGDFQAFVATAILPAYPTADLLFLLVDGSTIDTSKSTQAWLQQRPQIVLVPLPKYAPKLKLQEQIWRWLRQEVTHNHFFGSLADELEATLQFVAMLAEHPQLVLQRIGRAFPSLVEHHLATIV